MDCFSKTIIFSWKEHRQNWWFRETGRKLKHDLILAIKASRLVESGCEAFIAFITEDKQPQGVEDIPIVCEFLNVFAEEILGLPPIKEVEFTIELLLGIAPISIAPYRMTPAKLGELTL